MSPLQLRVGRSSENVLQQQSVDDDDDNADVDMESVWSEYGRLPQATVMHEFRAKRVTEVDLVVHETVVLLEDNDKNGWIKVDRSLVVTGV